MQFQRCSIDVGCRAARSAGIAVRKLVVSLLSDSHKRLDRRLRVVAAALFVIGPEFRNADLSKSYLSAVHPSTLLVGVGEPMPERILVLENIAASAPLAVLASVLVAWELSALPAE